MAASVPWEACALALDAIEEGVVVLDQGRGLRYYNAAGGRLYERAPALMGRLMEILNTRGTAERLNREIEVGGPDHPLHLALTVLQRQDGALQHIFVIRDVTAERVDRARHSRESSHDPLTGLLNRAAFLQKLNRHTAAGLPGVVFAINLRHFKAVNDRHGYAAGDLLLRHLATGLPGLLPAGAQIARFPGDEFAALLPAADLDEATGHAQHLAAAVPGIRLLHQGHAVGVAASLGGIWFDASTKLPADALLSHADAALRQARRDPDRPVRVYAHAVPEMASVSDDREWARVISRAIEEGRVTPVLQPIVHLTTGRISHYEALARLDSGVRTLGGDQFIPQAERLGLVGELDLRMLRSVLELLGKNLQIEVAVNLSGLTLNQPAMHARLFEILEQYAPLVPRLIFEITESVAIDEIGAANEFIRRGRSRGCRFAIDDFGVGYSSLQTLAQLPVDYLKIDGSLIRALDSGKTALLRAVQGLADALNTPTVAEHVDTEEKLVLLKSVGITYAQGYVVGRGLTPAELTP